MRTRWQREQRADAALPTRGRNHWWHQIDVLAIDEKAPKGKYPKMTKRVGKSPPQYMGEGE